MVSVKYVSFILRADNDGEGGIMALAALVRAVAGDTARRAAFALALGVLGASLFYGDSLITPAISVLSAVEGLEVAAPELADAVLPIGDRHPHRAVRRCSASARTGSAGCSGRSWCSGSWCWPCSACRTSWRTRRCCVGLSPTYAVSFVADHPFTAFIAMGAVVLVITGAEALYADMGHFGRRPIRVAWFALVFPALILNYLGQAALIVNDPARSATRSTCWRPAGRGFRWSCWPPWRRSSPRRR